MLQTLFSSRVRTKLLTTFIMSPGVSFHALDLATRLSESYSAVWRELGNLEKAGILDSETGKNSKAYRIDPRCPILPELRGLVLKTEGLGSVLRTGLSATGTIQSAFIYGSFASGEADERSDLDIMIIGEVDLTPFSEVISSLERDLSRAINYTIFPIAEWQAKVQERDPFIMNVIQSPKIILLGDENAL